MMPMWLADSQDFLDTVSPHYLPETLNCICFWTLHVCLKPPLLKSPVVVQMLVYSIHNIRTCVPMQAFKNYIFSWQMLLLDHWLPMARVFLLSPFPAQAAQETRSGSSTVHTLTLTSTGAPTVKTQQSTAAKTVSQNLPQSRLSRSSDSATEKCPFY